MSDRRAFQLYACNVPVAGASKAIICDLQRRDYFEIPLALHELLIANRGRTVAETRALYPAEDREFVDQAFAMLVAEDLGFWSEDGQLPALDLTWDTPETISNAIVDVDRSSQHDYPAIFAQLDGLGCAHLEMRFYDPVAADELERILAPTLHGRLRTIHLTLPYAGWDDESFDRLCEAHARIAVINVFGAPENGGGPRQCKWIVRYFRQSIASADDCGRIHPGAFSTNLTTFAEAQQFNSCLNKKLGIDTRGQIKNCPSQGQCHGTVAADRLVDVVMRDSFRKPWAIRRDQVEICRDCEYRYICTDCRVFISDPDDPLSKPARCGYDPYTGSWSRGA